jgi:protein-disulfide isomerase
MGKLKKMVKICTSIALLALTCGQVRADPAFDAQVRDTLLRNPEIILEVFDLLEAQQAVAETEADLNLIEGVARHYFADDPSETAILVEFVDYQCSYCRRAHGEVAALVEADQQFVRRVVQLPILGDVSTAAAEIVLAIRADQGEEAYLAAHDAFMGGDARYTQRPMLYVEEAGFDSGIIQQLTQSAEVQAEISQTREIAQALGISGTPGFITRTNILRGYADSATLSEAVFRFEEQE